MAIHREIYILAGMNHKGIMRLFEVIDNPTRCHLVMELCLGKNLYQFIRRKLPKCCLTEAVYAFYAYKPTHKFDPMTFSL